MLQFVLSVNTSTSWCGFCLLIFFLNIQVLCLLQLCTIKVPSVSHIYADNSTRLPPPQGMCPCRLACLNNIRPDRLHSVHRMHTYCYRRNSMVCVSVGYVRELFKTAELIKGWFQGTHSGGSKDTQVGPMNHVLDGSRSLLGRGNLGGGPAGWKALESLLWRFMKQRSIMATSGLQLPHQCSRLVSVALHCRLWNIATLPPLQCRLSSEFFDHLLCNWSVENST